MGLSCFISVIRNSASKWITNNIEGKHITYTLFSPVDYFPQQNERYSLIGVEQT